MKTQRRDIRTAGRQKNYFLALDEILAMPPQEWLIKDLIPKGGVGVLYGASNSHKSFFALHLCLCCALGREAFAQKPCKEVPVFYIAAEGARGFKQRTEAWMKHYGATPEYFHLRQFPVYVAQEKILEELILEIKERNPLGEHCFVVIDTLSTNFAGDENSNDMAKFMQACTRLSQEVDATVMIVHHTGKDAQKGARGHNSLIANADFVISMKRSNSGGPEIKVEKLKDSPTGLEMRLKTLHVMLDPKAEIPGSLVLEENNGFERMGDKARKDLMLFEYLANCSQERISQKMLVQQLIEHYGWGKSTADKIVQRFLPDNKAVDIGQYIVERLGKGQMQRDIRITAK